MAAPGAPGIVFDSQGVVVQPKLGYSMLDEVRRVYRTAWASLDDMNASIAANAPVPNGLPDGFPNPNHVFLADGLLVRYVVDPDVERQYLVVDDHVEETIQARRQLVALTLEGARKETDAGRETDFWCGYTWIRGGYSPERTIPVMVQAAAAAKDAEALTFRQPVSPTDAARVRHEVAAMDRKQPTLPVVRSSDLAPQSGAPTPPPTLSDAFDTAPGEKPAKTRKD